MVRRRTLLATAAGVGMVGQLTGCTLAPDQDHNGPDAPQAVALPKPARIAWVFSSGGPRGFAHVGVIKALAELGCVPDLLVGASIGALVAVVYAAGKPAPEIERMALDIQVMGLGRLAMGSDEKFSGSAIADLVRQELGSVPLQRLPTPAVCVVARRNTGQLTGFNAGDAGLAVQASCAIEGQFTPVRIRGQQYVDPDLYQPLPVRMAQQLGATRVLAIDASAHEDKAPPGTERYRAGDLRKRALTEPDARAASLTLHPEFGYYVNLSREYRQRAIEAGYRTTMAAAKQLATLHAPT